MISEGLKRKLSPVTGALDFQEAIEAYYNEMITSIHKRLENEPDIMEIRFLQGRAKQLNDLRNLQTHVRGK